MSKKIRVWDLPTRLFHWSLLTLVVVCFVSAKISGNAMVWHSRCGYAVLVLLVFRLIWGFVGGHHSRFKNFLVGPAAIKAYLAGMKSGKAGHALGHNPLGALSVIGFLASLLFQAVSGLFANDDIAFEGPLSKYVSSETASLITKLHLWNEKVLIALVVLHIAAIVFYTVKKKQALIGAMISGDKMLSSDESLQGLTPSQDTTSSRVTALVIVAALIGLLLLLGQRLT